MSQTKPLTERARVENYRAQNGTRRWSGLTPRQLRRVEHKAHKAAARRETP